MASQGIYGTHNLSPAQGLWEYLMSLCHPLPAAAEGLWVCGTVGLCSLIQGLKPGLNESVEKKGKRFY